MRKQATHIQFLSSHIKEWNQLIGIRHKKQMRWGLHDEAAHEVLLELSVLHERSPPR